MPCLLQMAAGFHLWTIAFIRSCTATMLCEQRVFEYHKFARNQSLFCSWFRWSLVATSTLRPWLKSRTTIHVRRRSVIFGGHYCCMLHTSFYLVTSSTMLTLLKADEGMGKKKTNFIIGCFNLQNEVQKEHKNHFPHSIPNRIVLNSFLS